MEDSSDDGFGIDPVDSVPGPSSFVLNNASSSSCGVVSSSVGPVPTLTQIPNLRQDFDPDVVDQYIAQITDRHRWNSMPQQAWLTHTAERRLFFSPYALFESSKRPRYVPVPLVPVVQT